MRILLGTDASPESIGAVRMAAALARELGASVQVLRVLEPPVMYGVAQTYTLWMPDPAAEGEHRNRLLAEVARQLADVGPEATRWPISGEYGSVAFSLVRAAETGAADLIVMGTGRHARLDRWLGSESAPRVMHLSHIPVMAVSPDAAERPAAVVVAVDFSEFSRDAARNAIALSAPGAEIHFAHVLPNSRPDARGGNREKLDEYRAHVRERLVEWVAEVVEGEAKLRSHVHLIEGPTAEALLDLARREKAELIASGSHGAGFLGRLMLGSVSTRLVREATCSVLIAPPREPAPEVTSGRPTE